MDVPVGGWKQLVGYDVTIWMSQSGENYRSVCTALRQVFKKWVFQKERCPQTGTLHWQCRGHLHNKLIPPSCVKTHRETLFLGCISPTSADVHTGNQFNYVMKAYTRVEGPWTDKDSIPDPPPLTRQLRGYYEIGPCPWHLSVKELAQQTSNRDIHMILETCGNLAKSVFVEAMEYEGVAFEVPALMNIEDIMQCVMGVPAHTAYFIDLPRALPKSRMASFFAGLECLKNGVMYDKRYSFKKRRIDRPQIFVFSNTMPDKSYLSWDRWRIYSILEDKTLRDSTLEYMARIA